MKTTVIVALIVAALIAFTVFDTKRGETAKQTEEQSLTLVKSPIDQIKRIEIRPRTGVAIILEKQESDWYLREPIQESADPQEVRNFLMSMNAERTREIVIEGSDVNFATYGLDTPPYEILLTSTGNASERIRIGRVRAMEDNLYARLDDESKVRLVTGTWDMILAKRVAEFRNKLLYRSGDTPVTKLEILQTRPGSPARMVFEKPGDDWKVVEGDKSYPLSNDRVNAYIEAVKDLRAQDFHAEDKSAAGVLAKFKLKTPAVTVRFFNGDKKTFELEMSDQDQRGDAYAVSTDLKPVTSIFKVAAEPVYRRSDDFFAKKLPFTFDAAKAAKVSVKSARGEAVLEKKDGEWAVGLQKLTDQAKVNSLIQKLAAAETLRVFEPGKLTKAPESEIEVKAANGDLLLKVEVGGDRIEKATGARPEAKYRIVKTSQSDRLLGLPEKTINEWNLDSVLASAGQSPASRKTNPK